MSALNDRQLQDLANYLEDSLRRHEPLQEELLDHLACMVEERLAEGLDYPTAKRQVLDYFTKDEVQKTEGKTLYFTHTKPVLMKIFSFLCLAFFLGLATLPFGHLEEKLPTPQKPMASVELPGLKDPPDIAPLNGKPKIISGYGQRLHPVFKEKMLHRGLDFKAPLGTPILATADGTIAFADEEEKYGLKVIIQHDGQYQSLYAHLSEIKVKKGEQVKKGTIIGLVGSTGLSTAPHLHYEILKSGKAVNPADYLPKS